MHCTTSNYIELVLMSCPPAIITPPVKFHLKLKFKKEIITRNWVEDFRTETTLKNHKFDRILKIFKIITFIFEINLLKKFREFKFKTYIENRRSVLFCCASEIEGWNPAAVCFL